MLSVACAAPNAPAPTALRDRDLPLLRVDGRRVTGDGRSAAVASRDQRADCQNRVADGTLRISRDGRSFTYRSTMRDCEGRVLLSETNEGLVNVRGDTLLEFIIHGTEGPATFRGRWTDSTVAIFELGGNLEFSRRPAAP